MEHPASSIKKPESAAPGNDATIALVVATGVSPGMEFLNERYPSPMLPLADRPFIQHIVEFLVKAGITRFHFVLSHLPMKIEYLLGDGSRWGSIFRFHLTRDPDCPYDMLGTLPLDVDSGPVLLAHADRLPRIDVAGSRPGSLSADPILFVSRKDGAVGDLCTNGQGVWDWTGWAWLPVRTVQTLPRNLTEESLRSHLLSLAHTDESRIQVPQTLSVRTCSDLLAANRAVLGKQFPGLLLGGTEADESIWLSRNVSLHPTATLTAPVYICENCRIGKGIRLGPDVVIGRDCVIDAGSTITQSLVFPGSYVGESLEVADGIVDKNLLINMRVGAAVPVSDGFILGATSPRGMGRRLWGIGSRGMAVLLLMLLWPVILATALILRVARRGRVIVTREAVRLPASVDKTLWRSFTLRSFARDAGDAKPPSRTPLAHFFLQFLPALIPIAGGSLRFVGVSPRTREEIAALSRDWQALYLRTKAGVVSEAYVTYGDSTTDDERYASEIFYSVTSSFGHDLKILLAYFGLVFFGRR